jgi:hypothetical protein
VVDPIDAGTGNVLQPKTVIPSSIKTLPFVFCKAVLHQKYVLEKRSMRQIAAEFASSKTAVRDALLRYGIPLREAGENPRRAHNLRFGRRSVNGKVVVHKGEERAIKSIFKMHREGLSNGAIARVLTEMKIPTKQQGKKWHREMVRQILVREKRLD